MRIGFMGAQGVGKTTLLKELVGYSALVGHAFIPGMTRNITKRLGLPINEQGTFETQKALVKNMVWHLKAYENLVTDRTLLDIYAYTVYMHEKGKLDSTQVNYIRQRVIKYQPLFDLVVFMRPEFPLVADGVRSVDASFAIEVAACMERVVHNHEFMGNKRIIEVSGSPEARAMKVIEAIRNADNV